MASDGIEQAACGDLDSNNIGEVIAALSDHTTDPNRPFTGQAHTENGERGKTEVRGIRFRDLADCIVKAFVNSAPNENNDELDELRRRADDGTLNYNDLYRLDLSEMDPLALVKNVCCRVEKAMGIFPNLPRLKLNDCRDEETDDGK